MPIVRYLKLLTLKTNFMKPIIKKEEQDTILTSEITANHIVALLLPLKNERIPCLLKNNTSVYEFISVNGYAQVGEGTGCTYNSIQDAVKDRMKMREPVAVFYQSDWKLALQWLIDNA